jgi:hypothetical protein
MIGDFMCLAIIQPKEPPQVGDKSSARKDDSRSEMTNLKDDRLKERRDRNDIREVRRDMR